MRQNHNLLFISYDLRTSLKSHEQKMFGEIDKIKADKLLNTSVDDWCAYFEQEYKVEVPKFKEDEISVDQGESRVDVSRDPNRYVTDRSQPFYIEGTQITYYIPFEGDAKLFQCKPSTYSLNPPRGEVSGNELILRYSRTDHDASAVKSEFEKDFAAIKKNLERLVQDSSEFNSSLASKIRERIDKRRQKFLNDQGMVANLGFPLRRRNDAPKTYTVPSVSRKIVSRPTPATDKPFKPEPVLEMKEYEHILSIISDMALVLERSPKSFREMEEEDIRQHFLVQLNGQYSGQATGETFNAEGKTDILIRVENKNIFIAECKFWDGPESLIKALNQLLGYTSWRDTKTALIIFNRNKNLSAVLEKITPTIKGYKNYKREVEHQSETGFRFILNHNNDSGRELTLTVLVFEVPKE